MKKRIALGLAVVVGLWLLTVAVLTATAYAEASEGREKLVSLSTSDVGDLRAGTRDADLAAAADHLETAHRRLSNPLLAPLRPVPFLGTQLASARDLTEAGAITASVAYDALRDVRQLSDNEQLDRPATLRRAGEICAASDIRIRQAELGPRDDLLAPLASARAQAVERLNQLDSALIRCAAAADGLATLLTTDARYLLIAANNAEMRNGSGMFLQAGLLETGAGQLNVTEMTSVAPLAVPDSAVTWPDYLEKNWGFLGLRGDMRNVMLSPRYDVGAVLAKQIWEASGRPEVDGVITVDVAMMKALVAVAGPITVDGQILTADNVERTLLYDQYVGISPADAQAQVERREGLGDLASTAFSQFANGDWELTAAARQFSAAAEGRHLMIWSVNNDLNRKWVTAGVGGVVWNDSLLLAAINLGTNKLDQFLTLDSTMDVRRKGEVDEYTVTIRVANNAPVEGPNYVLGPLTPNGAVEGEYVGMLAATLPADTIDAQFNEQLALAIAGQDGENVVVGTGMSVPRGNTQIFVLTFSRPIFSEQLIIEPSARIPAVTWRYNGMTWNDGSSKRLEIVTDG